MQLTPTRRFEKALAALSDEKAAAAKKALKQFLADQRHPSLNFEKLAKPYASIRFGGGDRIILRRTGSLAYDLVDVGTHDINRTYS